VTESGPVLLLPEWDTPPGVFAGVTTRSGGSSVAPWDSFNLGTHVEDNPAAVQANRAALQALLQQRSGCSELSLQWLQQVHGCTVHEAALPLPAQPPQADAVYTQQPGIVCAVLTADCLPVLFAAADGSEVAVAHAGWRGLVDGVLEQTVARFRTPAQQVQAWLGPAIAACHFEVGPEVRQRFLEQAEADAQAGTAAAFRPAAGGKYMADLYQLARLRLQALGLRQVSGTARCTVCDAGRWYSYRREGRTGRFATLIFRTP
jgi:YfiH family protein